MKAFALFILALIALGSAQDWNCFLPSNGIAFGACTQCYSGYWASNAGCVAVTAGANCATYSQSTGACLTCWWGSTVVGGVCVSATAAPSVPLDWNCALPSNGVAFGSCTACVSGYWASNAGCVAVTAGANCATYSQSTGACLTCWWGSTVVGGVCVLTPTVPSTPVYIPNCSTIVSGSCTACVGGFYLNGSAQCILGSGNCATYTSTGACATCWSSDQYVSAGQCLFASPTCSTLNADGSCATCWWGIPVAGVCA